jgi:hypothetical protein
MATNVNYESPEEGGSFIGEDSPAQQFGYREDSDSSGIQSEQEEEPAFLAKRIGRRVHKGRKKESARRLRESDKSREIPGYHQIENIIRERQYEDFERAGGPRSLLERQGTNPAGGRLGQRERTDWGRRDASPEFYAQLPVPWNHPPFREGGRGEAVKGGERVQRQASSNLVAKLNAKGKGYPLWRAQVISLVHRKCADIQSKYLSIWGLIEEEAKAKLALNPTFSPRGYRDLVVALEDEYGGPRRLISQSLREIKSMLILKEGNIRSLKLFVKSFRGFFERLREADQEEEINTCSVYNDMVSLLPRGYLQDLQDWLERNRAPESSDSILRWAEQKLRKLKWIEEQSEASEHKTVAPSPPPRRARGFLGAREATGSSTEEEEEEAQDPLSTGFFAKKTHRVWCSLCSEKGSHSTVNCPALARMEPAVRYGIFRMAKWCFNCGSPAHNASECKRDPGCSKCVRRHHTLLHESLQKELTEEEFKTPAPRPALQGGIPEDEVALETVVITIRNPETGKCADVNALLDSGNSSTMITKRCAEELCLVGHPSRVKIVGIGGQVHDYWAASARVALGPRGKKSLKTVPVRILEDLAGDCTVTDWSYKKSQLPILTGVPVEQPVRDKRIDVIIGCDQPGLTVPLEVKLSDDEKTGCKKTPLGWVCFGATRSETTKKQDKLAFFCHAKPIEIPNWYASKRFEETEPCLIGISHTEGPHSLPERQETNSAVLTRKSSVEGNHSLHERQRTNSTERRQTQATGNSPTKMITPEEGDRTSKIRAASLVENWRHVDTTKNPADLGSRGASMEELVSSKLWWEGPEMIRAPISEDSAGQRPRATSSGQGPTQTVGGKEKWTPSPEAEKESKKIDISQSFVSVKEKESEWSFRAKSEDKIHPAQFSNVARYIRTITRIKGMFQSFRRAKKEGRKWLRVQVLVKRVHKPKNRVLYHPPLEECVPEIKEEELGNTEKEVIKFVQRESFGERLDFLERRGHWNSRDPWIIFQPQFDQNGILRLNGRTSHAKHLSLGTRCPVVLPNNYFAEAIMQNMHATAKHMVGYAWLVGKFKEEYWCPGAVSLARRICRCCGKCNRIAARPQRPLMAPLPISRIGEGERPNPFRSAGMDITGPVLVKTKGKAVKRWILVFTCEIFRAVCLEEVESTSADSTLLAIERLSARYPGVKTIRCDNAQGFVGASKALQGAFEQECVEKAKARLPMIKLLFGPAQAPNFQGFIEAKVKATKRAMSAVYHPGRLGEEELRTAVLVSERLINESPVYSSIKGDPNGKKEFTPADFLGGSGVVRLLPEHYTVKPLTKKWFLLNKCLDEWWKAFQKALIQEMRAIPKWRREAPGLEEGQAVCVLDQNTDRGHWKTGIIEKVIPGSVDGIPRRAEVRVKGRTLQRPVASLVPLTRGN